MAHLVQRALARLVAGSAVHSVRQCPAHSNLVNNIRLCSSSTLPGGGSSLSQELDKITDQLTEAEVPEPALSAKYLLSCCLSPEPHSTTRPVLAGDWTKLSTCTTLTQDQATTLHRLVQCRLARMPVQYILGNWDFHNITIMVRPPVFIPRPETEQLVDLVLASLPPPEPGKTLRLMEVGPGSGAVSLAILSAREDILITCVERSQAAIELTRDNASLLGLVDRIEVVQGKVEADAQLNGLSEEYDLVFSNPPYILRKDLMALAPEISLYEDLRALDGGAEGLDVILPLIELAGVKLSSGGLVILEVDPCHPHILPPKLESLHTRFVVDRVVEDFRDKERFIVLRKT